MSISSIGPDASKVHETADKYSHMWDNEEKLAERKANYTTLVNQYYDIATDFYEYGWGRSFHFAIRAEGETLEQSIARHEHYLALKLGLRPGMKVLDIGCGVGGPMMEIARFSGANITGINNNAYQISRGQRYVKQNNLDEICRFQKADFLHQPFPDNSQDAVYAIEATCHSPSKVEIYSEIFRVLKPGALFACYEWCLTDKYDPSNPTHRYIKKQIEIGDGLPDLDTTETTLKAVKEAGFEIIEAKDMALYDPRNPVPWYQPLVPSFSLSGFRTSNVGKYATHYLVKTLETLGLAPKGSLQAHTVLLQAHEGLTEGGKTGTFTPMYFFLARKPAN
jgi:sterol 24-C-methyltransferase